MKGVEDYKINLGVLVICEILELLKDNYFGCLPDDVENELENFNDILLKYLNINDPKYKKFDIDKVAIGYNEDEIANPKDMEKYYSKEEQEKYGVLGIEIKKVK